MKAQMKLADRSGARVALIVGPEELAGGTVTVRPLRAGGEQRTVAAGPCGGERSPRPGWPGRDAGPADGRGLEANGARDR